MSTTTTTNSKTTSFPSTNPTLTATYHNGLTSSTLTLTYPLPTTPPAPAPSSSGGAPPLPLLLPPPLEAKTAYLKRLRELCTQLQGDLNDVLTEMMRQKDMDLGEQEQEEDEEEDEQGEEGEEKI